MVQWKSAEILNVFTKNALIPKLSTSEGIILNCNSYASYSRRKRNHYEVLGIPYDATDEEIKNAFVEKSQQLHPDGKNFNPEKAQSMDKYAPDFTEQFMQLKLAYDILRRPTRRKQYDQLIGTKRLQRFSERSKNLKLYDDKPTQKSYGFAKNIGMTAREFVSRDFYVRLADSSDNSLLYFTAGGFFIILILQRLYVWYLEYSFIENSPEVKDGIISAATTSK